MKGKRFRSVLLGVGLLMGSLGCAAPHPTEQYPTEQHPAWISELPESKKELCAVGISGPTYYAEDARAYSKDAAMTELGKAVEVTVMSQMTMETNGDATTSNTVMRERAGFSSEVVLKAAQVRAQWVNTRDDKQYGAKGTVYTLLCTTMSR